MRIIPTRMGTSHSDKQYRELYLDHPHAYGDKFNFAFTLQRNSGSSPRVWGQASSLLAIYII